MIKQETTNLKPEPSVDNSFLVGHAQLLNQNFYRWTGKTLIPDPSQNLAEALYSAPFVVLTHNIMDDPIFNYANKTAQTLFEIPWCDFVCLPSRLSAEAPEQSERNRLLKQVKAHGYIDDYEGIRVSRSGKRFFVDKVVVWNLFDENEQYQGQAALIRNWKFLN